MADQINEKPQFEYLGERALLIHWPQEAAASRWGVWLKDKNLEGIEEVVIAYRSVAVLLSQDLQHSELVQLELAIKATLEIDITCTSADRSKDSLIEVPVVYDGPDLDIVAKKIGLSVSAIVAWHTSQVYQVYAIGFLPGFPYCGYLPEAISGIARLEFPRTRVPAGSVAIAGRQTGIYPCESPGGWHLLGRTDLEICDLDRHFFRFRAGDLIQFRAESGGVLPDVETYKNIEQGLSSK